MISNLISEADQALGAGRLDRAKELCDSVLKLEPDHLTARLILGAVLVRQGRAEMAAPILQRVVAEDPTSGQAAMLLSRSLRMTGRTADALAQARIAAQREPGNPAIQHQLGVCCLENMQYEEAVEAFMKAIKLDPNASAVHHGLGLALQALGWNSAAVRAFRRALDLAPNSVQPLASLYQALSDESDSPGAVECARSMLALQPTSPDAHLRLASALISDNKVEEAEGHLEAAMNFVGSDGGFAFAAGSVLQSLGRFERAEAEFKRSVEVMPEQGLAYAALAYSHKVGEADRPLLEKMNVLNKSGRLAPNHLSHLYYGLGKALEDLGEYEGAMSHFDEANRLSYQIKFGNRTFDQALYKSKVDSTIGRSASHAAGSGSKLPIFVVGMIRSGTTLVEQILSSHPNVTAGGEQGFWLHNRDAAFNESGEVDPAALKELAEQYLTNLERLSQSSSPGGIGMARYTNQVPETRYLIPDNHVVNKMPDNYREVGLLHMAYPNAKIIHCTRHPADNCISIYTTINRLRLDWVHKKEDIVFVYRQYLRLMEHWRALLPPGTLIDVSYEDLVSDRERITRDVVAFCGLEWNEACLYPERNDRSVNTPSVWQVRQPVYNTSIGRWRNYEPWLGAFRELV